MLFRSEPVAARRVIAKAWGADVVLDPASDDVVAAVKDATGGYGADAVALTVGVHELVAPTIDIVRKQGVINMFAGFPPNKTVPFDPNLVHYGEISLTGTAGRHTWVVGAALQSDWYRGRDVSRFDYTYWVPSLFAQDDLTLSPRLAVLMSAR